MEDSRVGPRAGVAAWQALAPPGGRFHAALVRSDECVSDDPSFTMIEVRPPLLFASAVTANCCKDNYTSKWVSALISAMSLRVANGRLGGSPVDFVALRQG
jgi:hypothetical protein